MRKLWLLTIANMKEIIRDPMALFWFFAFPVLFMFLFGSIFSGEGSQEFPIGLVIERPSPLSEGIYQATTAVPSFKVFTGTREEELSALEKGKRSLVLIIPQQSLPGTTPVEVPVYYDASKTLTSQVLLPAVQQLFVEMERQITGRPQLFQAVPTPVQAEGLTNVDFIMPGILAMALMQLGLFGSLRLVSLREQRILRNLGVTPLNRTHLVTSEITVRLCMGLAQTVLITLLSRLVFDITIVSSLILIWSIALFGAAVFTSLGYMVVSFVRSEEAGAGVIQVIQFPMMFLSGLFFPTEILPGFLQPVTKVIPLTYLADALRLTMVGDASVPPLSLNLLVLAAWLIGCFLITILFWKWE